MPDTVRDRYGWNPLGQNLLMARRLIEAGVRLVSVTAFSATVFDALGIPPETRLGLDGFTRPASTGQPLTSLFV